MKKNKPNHKSNQAKKKTHSNSNTSQAQRDRLEAALREGPVSTIKARHELDIMAPAPRIFELRHNLGKNIITHWRREKTPEGYEHNVAYYVLHSGKWKGAKNNANT